MSSIKPIASPNEIKKQYPVSASAQDFLSQSRAEAKRILWGETVRKALIIGPCSIHDRNAALEYARRFKQLAKKVCKTCFLVMRVYCEKSRTARGWKGLLYDPHLDASHDIYTGILWTRELLLTLAEWQIPVATEFVDPLTANYFEDLITWGFIGARTSACQTHRQFVSSLEMPVGFKNSTDGNLDDAIHAVAASAIPHTFLTSDAEGVVKIKHSKGNPYTHIVLRGATTFTNYDAFSVANAKEKLEKSRLLPRLMIDCSHGNCQKQEERQKDVFHDVLQQIETGNDTIFGLMLESNLEGGQQLLNKEASSLKYAVSITDPCIDWNTTQDLILLAQECFSSCFHLSR